jgi:hypothetical protein
MPLARKLTRPILLVSGVTLRSLGDARVANACHARLMTRVRFALQPVERPLATADLLRVIPASRVAAVVLGRIPIVPSFGVAGVAVAVGVAGVAVVIAVT